MSKGSQIHWCHDTWNFLAGCTKVSRGCKFCYAARLAATRLKHTEKYEGLAVQKDGIPRWNNEVRWDEETLLLPLSWRAGKDEPRRIFVNSMSDLYHEDVPDEIICRAFSVMRATPHHRYQILTKRVQRLVEFHRSLAWREAEPGSWEAQHGLPMRAWRRGVDAFITNPSLPNVALGVSVEDAETAFRIWNLKKTPAAIRFISAEPLVGDLGNIEWAFQGLDPVHQIIVGGESGPSTKIESMDIAWALSLCEQAQRNGAAAFYKQPGDVPMLNGQRVKKEDWTREAVDADPDRLHRLPAEFPPAFGRRTS